MAFVEVQGNNGGNVEEMEPREFVSAKIGTSFEGTFVDMRPEKTGPYGEYRPTLMDLNDGRKIIIRASKYLRERLENADLNPGDGLKIVVEAKKSKNGYTYGNPRVYVDRKGGQPQAATSAAEQAPAAPEQPKQAEPAPAPATSAPSTDDLPF